MSVATLETTRIAREERDRRARAETVTAEHDPTSARGLSVVRRAKGPHAVAPCSDVLPADAQPSAALPSGVPRNAKSAVPPSDAPPADVPLRAAASKRGAARRRVNARKSAVRRGERLRTARG